MKAKDIEVGKEYAAGTPKRYQITQASRVKVLVVGVYGQTQPDYWGSCQGSSEKESYVLVEDLSDPYWSASKVLGEYGETSIERPLGGFRSRIDPQMDKRNGFYYSKKLKEVGGPTLTSGAEIRTIPLAHILEPWVEFAPAAKEAVEKGKKAAEKREKAERELEELIKNLRKAGLKSAGWQSLGVRLSTKDAETVLDKLAQLREREIHEEGGG